MKFFLRAHCVIFIFAYLLLAQNLYAEYDDNSVVMGGSTLESYSPDPLFEEDIQKVLQVLDKAKEKPISEVFIDMFPLKSKVLKLLKNIASEEKYSEEQRISAMQILGFAREDSYAYVLFENLLLGYKDDMEFERLQVFNFPVGFALIRMGPSKTIRTQLLNKIKYSRDDEVIRLCAFVLMEIEDKDVAGFILKREIDKEKNDRQKTNLEMALSFLK
ncbi:MAG: hypothetical protein KJ915_00775 [Candidatus Omnitrophica bacterium]|nr:hypothetical protein [Candidatus Omnitrophota bacterium]